MSFKIPRVEFPRRQPDERIGSDYSFLPMRSSSQEKWQLERTSSQLTNSSLFSRDEFEDTLSLSQSEDSQLFWSSLRKLWNSDGAENETADSENNHNNAETEQLQTAMNETLSEIQFILSDLEQDTQSWKCTSNVNGTYDSSDSKETESIMSLVKTIQNWVKLQKEQANRFEQCLHSISSSQLLLNELAESTVTTFKNILDLERRRKICTPKGIPDRSRLQFSCNFRTPREKQDSPPGSQCIAGVPNLSHSLRLSESAARRSKRQASVNSQSKNQSEDMILFSKQLKSSSVNEAKSCCTRPNSRAPSMVNVTALRMTFPKTPITVQKRSNIRSTLRWNKSLSVPSLVPAVKETTPPKCSTRYVRNSLHLTEDWNKKPFGDLFSASSPSSSSDTSDCFSFSSLSDI